MKNFRDRFATSSVLLIYDISETTIAHATIVPIIKGERQDTIPIVAAGYCQVACAVTNATQNPVSHTARCTKASSRTPADAAAASARPLAVSVSACGGPQWNQVRV